METTEHPFQEPLPSAGAVERSTADGDDPQEKELGHQAATAGANSSEVRVESGLLERRPPWLPLLWLGVTLGIGDFLFFPLVDALSQSVWADQIVGIAFFGLIPAQAGLVAIWSALGAGRHPTRILAAGTVTLIGSACLALGLGVTEEGFGDPRYWEAMRIFLCCLPLLFLAVQAPLWPLRILFGWRIERVGALQASPPEHPLALRHMMLVTAALAASLAAARWVGPEARNSDWLLEVSMFAVMAAGASLLSTIPAVACLLGFRRVWLGLLAMLLYIVGWIAIAVAVMAAIALFQGKPLQMPPLRWGAIFGFMALGSFVVSLTGALLLARWCGYRLRRRERGKRQRPPNVRAHEAADQGRSH